MSAEPRWEDLDQAIGECLGQPMVTHWVLVASYVSADGEQPVGTFTSPGLLYWQKHGLLATAAASSLPQPDWMALDDDEEGES